MDEARLLFRIQGQEVVVNVSLACRGEAHPHNDPMNRQP